MTYFYAQLFAMDTKSGPWADRDVYISGPDHMIVKTAKVLRERGAPSRLIHYELNPKAGQGL
jgi:ferredoxin-NADP reductase